MPAEPCVLFASDVHLRPESPEISRAFFSFIDGAARKASALYLLGDIFDLWIGDDDGSPLAEEFAGRVRALSDGGVKVSFMAGNHDFLLGEDMARRCGMALLPDEAVVTHWGRQALLLHGDTLCTDDLPYMEWRAYSRDPGNIRKFLALPLEARRHESLRIMQAGADGRQAGMDKPAINLSEARNAANRHQCTLMIHGHTHEPGEYPAAPDGGEFTRIVLPAWTKGRGGYAKMNGEGIELVLLGAA